MEESQQQMQERNPTYWTSVAIAGLLFGIIVFIISLISTYTIINSEATGSYFSPSSLLWCFSCLFGAFGGMLATWHYAKEYDIAIKLGKGALMGFITGVVMALVSVVLSQVWQLIDPDMTKKMIDSLIANFEAMDLPEEQKQQMIDSTVESTRGQTGILSQLLWGIPLYGILNLITGMIGAKVFGKKEEVL